MDFGASAAFSLVHLMGIIREPLETRIVESNL